jgi:putative MATE family efflux protein
MKNSELKTMDMTSGDITGLITRFSLPLLAGNLFQQLYNTVDSIVVGNYVGKEALAAIGSTTSLINTLVGFFLGLAAGASVVISQYFGAHDVQNLRKTVHTMVAGTLILGVIFTIAGIFCSPFMLRLMATPDDVISDASIYLRIYFEGVLALMIYNTGAGILRAVGDSKRPLYFLIVSSLINVVLDLLFVVKLHWGIEGVAYATIISETVSAGMVLFVLMHTQECYQLKIHDLQIDSGMLSKITAIGLPAGIQQAVTCFSNVFVQAYINGFGSSCMAGWASYGKIDQLAFLPMQSISLASTTFVGQNFGAANIKRAKRGITISLALSAAMTVLIVIPMMVFATQLVGMFNRDPDVLYYGTFFLRICSPFYVLCCVNQIYSGALRGLGDAAVPMGIMIGSFVVFRQLYLFIVTHVTSSFLPVSIAYPVGWVVCSIIMFIHYRRYIRRFA